MATTKYVWDGDDLLCELDENDNVIVEYTRDSSGELISERRNGTTYTHHTDGFGSTIALTDESGNVTDTFLYNASGETIARTGTTNTPFRWMSQHGFYFDTEIGNYLHSSREYNPAMARWLSFDPISAGLGMNPFVHDPNDATLVEPKKGGPFSAKTTMDCTQRPNEFCRCSLGGCFFEIDVRHGDSGGTMCFEQLPGELDPTRPNPKDYNTSTCQSEINRSKGAKDFFTLTVPEGPCKFTEQNFPPDSPHPIWELLPKYCKNIFHVQDRDDPPNQNPHKMACFVWGPKVMKVEVEMSMVVLCGCELEGMRSEVLDVKGSIP